MCREVDDANRVSGAVAVDRHQVGLVDVEVTRERARRWRLRKLAVVLGGVAVYLWWRALTGQPLSPGLPDIPIRSEYMFPIILIVVLGIALLGPLLGAAVTSHHLPPK